MTVRHRIRFSCSFNPATSDFNDFARNFRPQITGSQWQELRQVLGQIYVLSDLANAYDIDARRIAEPLFLRKESARYYLPEDVVTHLNRIGDVGELLEVGFRASKYPISLERLCEGIEKLKIKTEELRKKAHALAMEKEDPIVHTLPL